LLELTEKMHPDTNLLQIDMQYETLLKKSVNNSQIDAPGDIDENLLGGLGFLIPGGIA
jgi:hypothetical protein